ncbi:MAG TPA: hypothetical protein VMW23_00865 [Sedimentisphaerales bacterium]|nr:hypothetical protein [Sedimentisphaerales bacterium]
MDFRDTIQAESRFLAQSQRRHKRAKLKYPKRVKIFWQGFVPVVCAAGAFFNTEKAGFAFFLRNARNTVPVVSWYLQV